MRTVIIVAFMLILTSLVFTNKRIDILEHKMSLENSRSEAREAIKEFIVGRDTK